MKKSHIKLFIGCIFIVFVCVLLPTFPSQYNFLDFSNTGPIGDTIGGLSSPVIGIIGSYLVFISFQEQLKANQMQFEALKEERRRYEADRWYQKKLDSFNELKKSISDLKFTMPIGDNSQWDYYDKVLEFGGVNGLRLIQEKLLNFDSINGAQKYAVNLYVYEFGQQFVNFSVLVKAVIANKNYFPDECRELAENIDELYYAHLLLPFEDISSKLNSRNDIKNIRTMLYKTNRELENYIDPDGTKRNSKETI